MNERALAGILEFLRQLTVATQDTGVSLNGSLWDVSGDQQFAITWDEDNGEYRISAL